MLLLLSFSCMMAMLVYQRFAAMPTRISIVNQYEPLLGVPYPSITICSPNQITISAQFPRCRGLFYPVLTEHGLCCTFNNMYQLVDGKRNVHRSDYEKLLVEHWGFPNALKVVADYEPDDALDHTIANGGSIRRHLQHFGAYHSSVCAKECFARRVWTACGCLPAFLPHLPPGRVCTLPAVPCFLRLKKQNHPTSAECECPRNCESRRYSADMTVGNLRAISHALDDI
ncbi:unnamed protein product [Chilo suppressalis]|uniref:Uncharacterized protein n=1 Tax=Chilo suppressalis TaxID=168631 RepID=A0ABN8B0S4_CHISP|nr:unnamed protein product [Chilo suppressalis]